MNVAVTVKKLSIAIENDTSVLIKGVSIFQSVLIREVSLYNNHECANMAVIDSTEGPLLYHTLEN